MKSPGLFALLRVAGLSLVIASPALGVSEQAVLATVRITDQVLADGKPLPAGTYELRLTTEHPAPPAGQPANAEQVVEFVTGGKVIAREVAEVLRDNDLTPEGASSRPVRPGVRVERLKGDEFLRISVKRGSERFLVHLPLVK
jgi:hypothetical protein